VSIDPLHVFTDPDSGSPGSIVRYYGGTINLVVPDGTSQWAYTAAFSFGPGGSGNPMQVLVGGGQGTEWDVSGVSSSHNNFAPAASSFDFVMKFSDESWNVSRATLFVGAGANALTEGTPLATWTFAASPITFTTMAVTFTQEGWGPGATLTVSNVFSSAEWTPVSAVPEPSTYAALLGALALGALAWGRRRA
jgi:hypothetical protein